MSRKLMIVDDHAVTVLGLRALLQRHGDFEVAAVANSGELALELLTRHPEVQVACLDMNLGGDPDGFALISALRARFHRVRTVVYTSLTAARVAALALDSGASAVVSKSSDYTDVLDALEAASTGGRYISPVFSAGELAEVSSLSKRQLEVLNLLAEGLGTDEIARRMVIGRESVKTHVAGILRKLGAQDRAEAVMIGVREGLVRF